MRETPAPEPTAPEADWCNLAYEALGRHAEDPAHADRPALTFLDREATPPRVQRWTYRQAWEQVLATAAGLRGRGLTPGQRVVVRLDHGPDYAFAFFGAIAAGLIPTPASPQLTDGEIAFIAADTETAALIAAPDRALPQGHAPRGETPRGQTPPIPLITPADLDAMREQGRRAATGSGSSDADTSTAALERTAAESPAYLIYTSGTGAQPKGVLHAHRSIRGRQPMHRAWQGLRPDDVVLHAGTLNWSYTLGVGLMDPWSVGAHALLASGVPSAQWPEVIAEHGVTVFAAVPTVYRQILKYAQPEALRGGSLRHGLCAGEALPPAVAAEWATRTGLPLYEALGMTEISTYISTGPETPVREGSPGRVQPGRRIAILDPGTGDDASAGGNGGTGGDRDQAEPTILPSGAVGLLAIHRSDPGLMLGYWRREAEQSEVLRGEWFAGGDLASIDADGYVWFHGRADDLIKSFGYRLSPVEIESALSTCPGVAEVAVIARHIDESKTLVVACIVPEATTTAPAAPGEAASNAASNATSEALRAAVTAHAEQHLAAYKRPHEVVLVAALPRTRNGKVQRAALRAMLDG